MFFFFCFFYVFAQEKAIRWNLAQCIENATAGSLDAFNGFYPLIFHSSN